MPLCGRERCVGMLSYYLCIKYAFTVVMCWLCAEIAAGQACDGPGHEHLCVAGAACDSGTCTCKTAGDYSPDFATGRCSQYFL